MSDESSIARDVLIDVSGLSLADLPGNGDSGLLRALRRFLSAGDEAGVIAEWNQGF
jgi:FXSXX-COOH protein